MEQILRKKCFTLAMHQTSSLYRLYPDSAPAKAEQGHRYPLTETSGVVENISTFVYRKYPCQLVWPSLLILSFTGLYNYKDVFS